MTILLLFVSFLCWDLNAQILTSSTLPIVVINTGSPTFNDNTIPDDPKISASFGIIDNGQGMLNYLTDPLNHYDGLCGIETRGNSTQGYSKRTYSVELWNALGQDTSASLLGMGGEEDWILHSMVIDKSQLRIPFTFDLARSAGHYASNYRFVEVVIDGDYRGTYILCEKIKRDDDRVDIARLDFDDLAGDSLTGGYILRIDWLDGGTGFASEYNSMGGTPMFYQHHYPKGIYIQPAQTAYIKSYMDNFEEAVFDPTFTNGSGIRYNEYIDMTSFADFLIINEVSKNSDGYKLSSYLHKDKDSKGGKLKAGPIWDFDQTYGMSTVCSSHEVAGWQYTQTGGGCEDFESMPMWWEALMSDDLFKNHLKCRWTELRNGALHLDTINLWIDSHVSDLTAPINRNFTKWDDFIGEPIWSEPTPIPQSYSEEIQYLKDWIASRIAWLDTNIPGDCQQDIVSLQEEEILELEVFPNPASDIVYVKAPVGNTLRIVSSDGKEVYAGKSTNYVEQIDISYLNAGMYFLQVEGIAKHTARKLIIR